MDGQSLLMYLFTYLFVAYVMTSVVLTVWR
jgi:hypothetical protein